MNKVVLIGRLTKDIDLKYAATNGKAVAKFSLAVNRDFKNANGKYEADFINCTAFDKRAETLANYVSKGNRLAITGRIQTGSYEKDGVKHYTNDVMVDGFEFLENKSKSVSNDETMESPDYEYVQGDDIPF